MVPKISDKTQQIEKFVFVVTYGRSGSTLMQNLLNSLDGACVRGENAHALEPLALAWNTVLNNPNLRRMQRRDSPSPPTIPWYGGERINPDLYGRALAEVFTNQILSPPEGTRISGFKEICWAQNPKNFNITLDFARTFFPNARFIFNTRDHGEVTRSGWWVTTPEDTVRSQLVSAEALFDAYLSKHPDSGIRMHYNDYVRDHDALRPLFTFLDEPFDPNSVARVMSQKLAHLKTEE